MRAYKIFSIKLRLVAVLLGVSVSYLSAQTYSYGNLIIEDGGDLKIYNSWNFRTNSVNKNLGIIGTERGSKKGYISFMTGSNWIGANNSACVDGYVRAALDGPFVFPIGDNGSYRPVKISNSSKTMPTEAAYFGVDPSVAITSPFFGTSNSVLPLGGPFNTTLKESSITAVSSMGYWDINGNTSAKITLTWNSTTSISTLVNGNLTNLTILGWDGTKWVKIPSSIDGTSLFGVNSDLVNGSITSLANIIPTQYSVYTLGSIEVPVVPIISTLFSSKFKRNVVAQNKLITIALPLNANLSDTSLIISIAHSTPKFGVVTNSTLNGYTYTADNNYIGVDTVMSISSIYNKPRAITAYDTFISEIIVRYAKEDTAVDMGSLTTINLGKKFTNIQNLSISVSSKTKLGVVSNYSSGTFTYKTSKTKATDTVLYILEVIYLGKLTTKDTARYYIKLGQGTNSINQGVDRQFSIQNYINLSGNGSSSKWVLPKELTDKYPRLAISISNLDGKLIYESTGYLNDWPANSGMAEGMYIYQIQSGIELKQTGILRIHKE